MVGWKNFWKTIDLKEALESTLPDWLKPKTYIEIRKGVLDRPRQTIAARRRYVYRYAAFCATAPYALAAALLWIADFTHVIPPDNLAQHMAMISSQEKELVLMSAESAALCDRLTDLNLSDGKRCNKALERTREALQKEIDQLRNEAKSFSAIKATMANSIIAVIIFLLGAFIFSRVWLRFYPEHMKTTHDDIKTVSRAYLLVMSTTMFVPNCIGAAVGMLVNILERIDTAVAGAVSGWVVFAGLTPFAVCGVLGCYRLNYVLLNTHSWPVGKTWLVLLISNMITGLVALLIFAALFIIILAQGGALGGI
jgi:hypothetical protein